jgi:toxin CptA
MPHSTRSSSASAPCRLEWRPSRGFAIALCVLGVLGVFSLLASEMPPALAWPLALLAIGEGIRLARRHLRAPPRMLVWPCAGMPMLDGVVLCEPELRWRGPLAFLRWREPGGRVQRLTWWPDVLSMRGRRELRLAALEGRDAGPDASMAP